MATIGACLIIGALLMQAAPHLENGNIGGEDEP